MDAIVSFISALFSLFFILLFTLGPFILIVLVFVLAGLSNKRHTAAWGEFARGAGLVLTPGSMFKAPTVAGAYSGLSVYLYTYAQGSGKQKTTYTSMVVYIPVQSRAHLRVSREGFFTKITKAFGAQDIQIRDPAFDQAYVIKSDTPDLVIQLLTPQLRGALVAGDQNMTLTVSRGTASHTQVGILMEPRRLRYVLDTLVLAARRVVEIETPAASPQPPPAAPQQASALRPVSFCQNCGADLDWNAGMAKGAATCAYCGKATSFNLGSVPIRRG